MNKHLIILILFTGFFFTTSCATAVTPEIMGTMNIIDNNIVVNLVIEDVSELETLIRSGIEKEIIFTVELLRVWKYWPDEFVVSKKISKIIKYDNLREQYRASSDDGVTREERYFKDYESLKGWIFTVNNVHLANVKELESSRYYIRIVIESKSLEPLPLLGFLTHFIPEVEMSLAKESQSFIVGSSQ